MTREQHQTPRGAKPASGWSGRHGPAATIALVLSALWLVAALVFFVLMPGAGAGSGLMTLVAILMPLALIWTAALVARSTRTLHEENRRLKADVAAMRADHLARDPDAAATGGTPLAQKLDEIARVQKKTEAALAHLTSNLRSAATSQGRDRPALQSARSAEPADFDQQTLALKTPPEIQQPPISTEDFIAALNFPADEKDREGFRALARALRDPMAAGLVRSAQDMLTLLSEDGLYMDDFAPDRARPELWRQFARGERGPEISGLGGIRDRESLARAAGRMRQDPVFRDVAHHFLRRFDTALSRFEKDASDAEVSAFADTRTARAFMLVGRVSGTFH
ncbi:hypothetical protein [Tropicimonas sp. IMCC34043]|uniref:hypothetical protein n=1 Tax=Tropicimonas sp. IMCC34043 TaxID=2248760 RepID=UPI000E279DF8|nr:hypothetical protein [Tropicimonas sp. IMCC34043]